MKSIFYNIVVLFFILITSYSFGQTDAGKDFDLQRYLNKEIAKGKKQIKVPAGRYRVKPKGNQHILLKDLSDITIIADGVELICTETVKAIQISNCRNLTIQGLAVDYDPLPYTQGRIVAMSPDKTKLTVDILEGYSTKLRNDKLEIYSQETGELVTRTYYGVTYEVDEKNRQVVFSKKPQANTQYSSEELGDIVVFDTYHTRFSPHAVVMENCENLLLENMTVYAGPTFAFFEKDCNSSTYRGCKVDRRPLESDLVKREVRRLRSNNADGFHSKNAQIGPSYQQCIARYNGDDGFAISGSYHVVSETQGDLMTVIGKAGKAPNIEVGDVVELISYEGNRLPDAVVKSIKVGRAPNQAEKDFLSTQKFLKEAKKTKDAPNVYLIQIDRPIELPMGSMIASANRLGNGFEIVHCTAGPNRSRGIIAKASNGTISNNQLIGNWGMGIKCSPEYQWLEAGSGKNLTITNNIVVDCHDVGIAVYANGPNGKTVIGAHTNVNISNNRVSGSITPAFAITSTTGLKFMDNVVESPNNAYKFPWQKDFGKLHRPQKIVFLENVENIEENFGLKNE